MNLLHQQNMTYKLIIFDFDGTIADTSPGILDSHKYALDAMGREVPNDDELRRVIGGQLLKTYINVFGFDEIDARKAVKIYRDRYAEMGIHLYEAYPGFPELVEKLKRSGYYLAVATLKAEKFAKEMITNLGLDAMFDVICGMDANDNLTKSDLIQRCMNQCNVKRKETILVGDSSNDYLGAMETGISFVGVTYGFGFKTDCKYDFDVVNNVSQLGLKFIKK